MNPTFRMIIILGICTILGCNLPSIIFDHSPSPPATQATLLKKKSLAMHVGGNSGWNNSIPGSKASFFPNEARDKGTTDERPHTILAAGDIAKCDGGDNWREKFLRLVKILPDDGPEEPFVENLLELLWLSEETDYPANAAMTADLILRLPGKVLALGDLAYPTGSTRQFRECYESTWGQFKERTHPVPGNHEYKQKNAGPYFAYWGHQAGEFGRGFYSFDLGDWHLIALKQQVGKEGASRHHLGTTCLASGGPGIDKRSVHIGLLASSGF